MFRRAMLRAALPCRSALAARVAPVVPRLQPVSAARLMSTAAAAAEAGSKAAPRAVGYWLMGTAGMVFVMVVLGGVTRLTRSGLSIVEWRPEGERYPKNEAEWQEEFEKYKAFPEYQRVNRHMTLEEFKPIYFMEWFHRAWGRAIGVAFGAPLLYFAARGMIPAGYKGRIAGLLGLGALQGGVGWWMVKSGLEHERFNEHSIPRVSPYRLAAHLGCAFSIYSLLLWTGLDLLRRPPTGLSDTAIAAARKLRGPVWAATGVIALTVASGAFVAGNDAGHAYNDWPLFAGKVIPEQIWEKELGMRNFTENTATVQFDHRMLAYSSLAAVGAVHATAGKLGFKNLPPAVRKGAMWLGALVAGQVVLGISTLMMYVPVSLGTAHQAGALALLTGAISMAHAVKQAAAAAPAAAVAGMKSAAKPAATVAAAALLCGMGSSSSEAREKPSSSSSCSAW